MVETPNAIHILHHRGVIAECPAVVRSWLQFKVFFMLVERLVCAGVWLFPHPQLYFRPPLRFSAPGSSIVNHFTHVVSRVVMAVFVAVRPGKPHRKETSRMFGFRQQQTSVFPGNNRFARRFFFTSTACDPSRADGRVLIWT